MADRERNDIVFAFSTWIRIQLAKDNIKQRDLAKLIGISEVCMSRYANGNRFPREKELQKILDYFNCHIEIVPNERSRGVRRCADG